MEREWFREEAMEVKKAKGNPYYIQCTTWRDQKEVMFVHTKAVGRLLEDYGVYSYNKIVRMSSRISVLTPTEYFALA